MLELIRIETVGVSIFLEAIFNAHCTYSYCDFLKIELNRRELFGVHSFLRSCVEFIDFYDEAKTFLCKSLLNDERGNGTLSNESR